MHHQAYLTFLGRRHIVIVQAFERVQYLPIDPVFQQALPYCLRAPHAYLSIDILGAALISVAHNIDSNVAGRILQVLAFSGCVMLGYAILRRVVSERAALLGAAALIALKPIAFQTWTMLNYSQVAMLLALAELLLELRFFERRRLLWLAASGATAGLSLLVLRRTSPC